MQIHENLYTVLLNIIEKKPMILVGFLILLIIVIVLSVLNTKQKNLETVQNKKVGNNQMGSARFMNEKEKREYFKRIEYNPKVWRENPSSRPKEQGVVWGLTGYKNKKGKKYTLLDSSDSNTLLVGPPGMGKTSCYLIPTIEYACATEQRLIITDTKGDIIRNFGQIMKKYYGYNIILIDFRNPVRGDSFNFLQLVNKYIDLAENEKDKFKKIKYQALAEKNAKIVAETIINSSGGSQGNNAYFYDTAKGILTSTILLISKYGEKDSRHIVSVFKVIQEMSEFETKEDDENLTESKFAKLINKLDENDKTKWFAGASVKADIKTASSCFSTALTILTKFIDTEIEQVLCFDSKFTIEDFVKQKSAIFVTLPEEDPTKHFLLSLLLNQIYGQLLHIADNDFNGKFPNRILSLLDEFGTLPKIEGIESIFTASRSRNILSVPIIQMFSQLKKYKDSENAIKDSCKNILFSGFSPTSQDAQVLSKAMGKYTTQTGSLNRSNKKSSISYSMSARDLMTPDEIGRLKFGEFILLRTGTYPLKLDMPLFYKWGIEYGEPFETSQEIKVPKFINMLELQNNIEKALNKRQVVNDEIKLEDKNENKLDTNLSIEEKFNTYHYEDIKINNDLVDSTLEEKEEITFVHDYTDINNFEGSEFEMNEEEFQKEFEEEFEEFDNMIINQANILNENGVSKEEIKDKIEIKFNSNIKFNKNNL